MSGARLDSDDRLGDRPGDRLADRTAALSRAEQLDAKEIQADVREAYERGRKDERASRRRHPVFMTLLFAAALCGVALLGLAAVNGSFRAGGSVADQTLSAAVSQVARN
jgi:hypothetical protein